MANVFDILNRKSSTSAEVAENEQMSRVSSRTLGSSDSHQSQGVNNDASAFENKDGAKASGNYAYGVESRHETQETTSPFTIPKLKRSKQDLFMDISTESREWQQEILPVLTKYFRFPASSSRYEFLRVSLIQNAERTQKYLEKRKEMRQSGYSERDVTDSFAFLYVDDDKQIEKISREGLRVGNLASSTIGHPGMGAQLCRYMDTIRMTSFIPGSTGKLLVFKVIKGKVKAVTENRSGPSLEPSPNYDCHMAKSSLDITPISSQQLYELYQVYLYEYGEDQTVEPYPRHVLPYAVITFRYKEAQPPSPRHLDSPPMFSPRLSSPPVPKFTVSAPKEAEDPEYVIWCGRLRVKEILNCEVKMVSTASQYKPAHLGTVLNVRDTCEMRVAGDRYFKELSCLRKSGEVYWKGWYINVAELRPKPDSKGQFLRLMNHLGRTESMAVLKPENDVILLLAPNSGLTNELGLTRPHHYPTMFHCIFLSRQSSKFRSPGYIQKLHQQKSGSSTPTWFDPGQSSPLSININPSSRPHTAPGSPAVGLPSLGFPFHSSSDRSPGYGISPRDELAVWTGVDHKHVGDRVKMCVDQSEQAQSEDRNVCCHESERKSHCVGMALKDGESEEKEGMSDSGLDAPLQIKTKAFRDVETEVKEEITDVKTDCNIKEDRQTDNEVGTGSFCDSPSTSAESRFSENLLSVAASVSGSVSGCSWSVASVPGVLLSPDVSLISAVSCASLYSSCSPFISTHVPSLLPLSQALLPSALFPTPPLLSPVGVQSLENQTESAVSETETKSSPPVLPSYVKPLRPLQIPKLVLPEHCPTSPKPLGPYSPISPAAGLSPQLYSPISPAAVSTASALSPSETKRNLYSPITPVGPSSFGPYSPISPVALTSPGPYSPISPVAGTLLSGSFASFLPSFSPAGWRSLGRLSAVATSQLLSVDTNLHSPWTGGSWSLPLDCRAVLSVAGKNDGGTKGDDDQLASEGGTSKLLAVVWWLRFSYGVSVVVHLY